MKRIIGVVIAVVLFLSVNGQQSQQDEKTHTADKQAIDKLCGCFEVDFKYAETFSPNPDYKFHDREKIGGTAA